MNSSCEKVVLEMSSNKKKVGYEILLEYPSLKKLMKPGSSDDDDSSDSDDELVRKKNSRNPPEIDADKLQRVFLIKLYFCSLASEKLAYPLSDFDESKICTISKPISASPVVFKKEEFSNSPLIRRRGLGDDGEHRQVEHDLRQLKKRQGHDPTSKVTLQSPVKDVVIVRKSREEADSLVKDVAAARKSREESDSPVIKDAIRRSREEESEYCSSPISRSEQHDISPGRISRKRSSGAIVVDSPNLAEDVKSPSPGLSSRRLLEGRMDNSESPTRPSLTRSNSMRKSERADGDKSISEKTRMLRRNFLSRQAKRDALMEIVSFIQEDGFDLVPDKPACCKATMEMVKRNIFRKFGPPPSGRAKGESDLDDDTPLLDPRWPHLGVVYEIFARLLDTKCFQKSLIDATFCADFVALFRTEDPRERDSLKTNLHKMYGMFPTMRPTIRKELQTTFEVFVNQQLRHSGILELLEVVGSIVSGFAVPLKSEHLDFFKTALIPLHRAESIASFHNQLTYCISQYVEKDPTAIVEILRALRKYYPHHAASKQLLFLNELEETLEIALRADTVLLGSRALRRLLPESEISPIFDDATYIVEQALSSEHFQVVERGLFLWNNDYFANHLFKSSTPRMRPVFCAVENDRAHWNPIVRKLSKEVAQLYAGDPYYEDAISRIGDLVHEKNRKDQQERQKMWDKIIKAAAANSKLK